MLVAKPCQKYDGWVIMFDYLIYWNSAPYGRKKSKLLGISYFHLPRISIKLIQEALQSSPRSFGPPEPGASRSSAPLSELGHQKSQKNHKTPKQNAMDWKLTKQKLKRTAITKLTLTLSLKKKFQPPACGLSFTSSRPTSCQSQALHCTQRPQRQSESTSTSKAFYHRKKLQKKKTKNPGKPLFYPILLGK